MLIFHEIHKKASGTNEAGGTHGRRMEVYMLVRLFPLRAQVFAHKQHTPYPSVANWKTKHSIKRTLLRTIPHSILHPTYYREQGSMLTHRMSRVVLA